MTYDHGTGGREGSSTWCRGHEQDRPRSGRPVARRPSRGPRHGRRHTAGSPRDSPPRPPRSRRTSTASPAASRGRCSTRSPAAVTAPTSRTGSPTRTSWPWPRSTSPSARGSPPAAVRPGRRSAGGAAAAAAHRRRPLGRGRRPPHASRPQAWEEIRTLDEDGHGTADRWVTASKLLARKRPRLVPLYDEKVRRVVALADGTDWWLSLREALRRDCEDNEVRHRVREAMREASVPGYVSVLRCLDVILWTCGTARHRGDVRRPAAGTEHRPVVGDLGRRVDGGRQHDQRGPGV